MGGALSLVQVLSHGVYIAMNGQIFDQENVKKNKKMGIFEELESMK